VKLDDRKALTVTLNLRRAAVEAACRRWFARHRELLAPLLPPATLFFGHLQAELRASTDAGAYVPLHSCLSSRGSSRRAS
jgi:SWI/SNF-related matrix-associated actin-dependent regulator of chromatin subfamily A member 5